MTPLEATKVKLQKRLDNSGVSIGTTSSPTFLGVLARHAFVVKNSDRASGIFLEDWTPNTINAYTHQYLCKILPYLENPNQPIATLTTEDLDVAIEKSRKANALSDAYCDKLRMHCYRLFETAEYYRYCTNILYGSNYHTVITRSSDLTPKEAMPLRIKKSIDEDEEARFYNTITKDFIHGIPNLSA